MHHTQTFRSRSALPAAILPATIAAVALIAFPANADAYIGPGAGFALISSFFVFFVTIVSALASLLLFPVRLLLRAVLFRRGASSARRVIVIGFDGQDPRITERLLAQGRLPSFARLAAQGGYHQLRTTVPPISPVAWSSFATGVQPGKHGIFDFIERDPRSYSAQLSGVALAPPVRHLRLGRFQIPLTLPALRLTRGSRTFWSILGEHRVWSTVLRVPVSFPPDRFYGAQLSATGTPDLKGSQGTFLLFTSRPSGTRLEGGDRIVLDRTGDGWTARLDGPPSAFRPDRRLGLPLVIRRHEGDAAAVAIGAHTHVVRAGELTDWIRLSFTDLWPVRVQALVRMQLLEIGDDISLYVSAMHLDPARPAMPLSQPAYYATYLEKRIGPFATLGLAEDTAALNEGVVSEATFLGQVHDVDRERADMLLAAMDRLSRGTLVCVFDATDRVQHMCWAGGDHLQTTDAIVDQYRRNDALLARVLDRVRQDDLVVVLSDHGFTAFERSVGLNAWLEQHGYLTRKAGTDGSGEWLADIDWSRTRAYALGLAGIFLNVQGREASGIVPPAAAPALGDELRRALTATEDPERGGRPIRRVLTFSEVTPGPYVNRAPDLFVGYEHGYRVSWDSAKGRVDRAVFESNPSRWSGDHCVDPDLVPGILFCNRVISRSRPSLLDIAPTVLHVFGIDVPSYMDGRSLFAPEAAPSV